MFCALNHKYVQKSWMLINTFSHQRICHITNHGTKNVMVHLPFQYSCQNEPVWLLYRAAPAHSKSRGKMPCFRSFYPLYDYESSWIIILYLSLIYLLFHTCFYWSPLQCHYSHCYLSSKLVAYREFPILFPVLSLQSFSPVNSWSSLPVFQFLPRCHCAISNSGEHFL